MKCYPTIWDEVVARWNTSRKILDAAGFNYVSNQNGDGSQIKKPRQLDYSLTKYRWES